LALGRSSVTTSVWSSTAVRTVPFKMVIQAP
jgi:hypothetical protein